ncbi:MAG: sigma 54-interacting transcriptional regulator [Deltaproteobacteria bacterium]|nr:sigma 54-interacting transcriptional regulator [Deltaproteobacteria bacterium]
MFKFIFFASVSIEDNIIKVLRRYRAQEEIEYRCELSKSLKELESYAPPPGFDAIIARGFSVDVLEERKFDCPIIRMKYSSIEVINAIFESREKFHPRKIAVIGPPSLVVASEIINKIVEVPTEIYVQTGPFVPTENIIEMALNNGCDTIVGGGTAFLAANKKNVQASFVKPDAETLWDAIDHAVKTITIQRGEREKRETLQTVMDHSPEGLMLIDGDGTVSIHNGFVEKRLGFPQGTDKPPLFESLLPNLAGTYEKSLRQKSGPENELFTVNSATYSASFVPVVIGGLRKSTLFIFQDVDNIQEMEAQIRKKIHAKGMQAKYEFSDIVSNDASMHSIIETAKRFAAVDSNVLVEGETGTGKELFAQSIHNASGRRKRPFVAINCAALPEHLLESELFGYAAGSFTGASKEGKKGLFELAHNGTLFLDEISEMPLSFQGKLLRALQEREILRIGDDKIIPIDVRIIAATNKDLRAMAKSGLFREDIYFRLDILQISIPPLRERPGDIIPLFTLFLKTYAKKFSKPMPELSSECRSLLKSNPWRGNVRELKNMAERVMAMHNPRVSDIGQVMRTVFAVKAPSRQKGNGKQDEKAKITQALTMGSNRQEAAKSLGMSRSTLWRKMKSYNLN